MCSSSCFEELGSPLMTSEMLNNYEGQKNTKPHDEEEVSFVFSSFFHCHIWFLVDAFPLGSKLNLSESIIWLFVLASLEHNKGKIILKSYWKNVNCIGVRGLDPRSYFCWDVIWLAMSTTIVPRWLGTNLLLLDLLEILKNTYLLFWKSERNSQAE